MQNQEQSKSTLISMTKFIENLNKKYKVLSKLTQKQSEQFQLQVISLLVDQNHNVDTILYKQIKNTIGMQSFILQILGTVIQRNPFINQNQLKKNISTITIELEGRMAEVNKKTKILSRKQLDLQKLQNQMRQRIKQYGIQIEKQIIKKLHQKENNFKKRINDTLNIIKNKQKLVNDRKKMIEKKLVEFKQLEQKPQDISNKIKKQKIQSEGLYLKNNTTIMKLTQEIKLLKVKCQKYENEIEEGKKRNKNSDLAYRRMKLQAEKYKQINKKLGQKLSQPNKESKKQQILQQKDDEIIIPRTKKQKINNNLIQLMQQLDISNISQRNIESQHLTQTQIKVSQTKEYGKEYQNISEIEHKIYPNQESQVENIIHKMNELIDEQNFEELINFRYLQQFCYRQIYEQKIENILSFYDLLLVLMQNNHNFYDKILEYLKKPLFISYFQQSYLNFESSEQICQATTLILSRIWMNQSGNLLANKQFQKAIKLRRKMMMGQPSGGMLDSNIIFLDKLFSQ